MDLYRRPNVGIMGLARLRLQCEVVGFPDSAKRMTRRQLRVRLNRYYDMQEYGHVMRRAWEREQEAVRNLLDELATAEARGSHLAELLGKTTRRYKTTRLRFKHLKTWIYSISLEPNNPDGRVCRIGLGLMPTRETARRVVKHQQFLRLPTPEDDPILRLNQEARGLRRYRDALNEDREF